MLKKLSLLFIGLGFFTFGKEIVTQEVPFIIDIIRWATGTSTGENMPDFFLFLGRFHPLILHLPLGIIIAVVLLELASLIYKFEDKQLGFYKKISLFLTILTAFSAFFAVVLGWFLASSLTYDMEIMSFHGYLCTIFAFACFVIAYLRYKEIKNNGKPLAFRIGLFISVLLVAIGGHYGGNLTHGKEYLFEYAPNVIRKISGREVKTKKAKASVQSRIYDDVIVSIMNGKCLSCHSEVKTKGDLRLDTYQYMLKGGENDGPAITPNRLDKSAAYYRITIDPKDDADEEIMPPLGKPPLTKEEIAIIEWWIKIGAPNKGKVINFKPDKKIIEAVKKQKIILEPILEKKKQKQKDKKK